MISETDEILLVALRRGKHFKANPGDALELFVAAGVELDHAEARSSARRLNADGLAAFVQDSEKPGRTWLRITDDGIAYADILIAQQRKKPWTERIKDVPRSDWIAIAAMVVSAVALFKPS
jgi:hypothetical protein